MPRAATLTGFTPASSALLAYLALLSSLAISIWSLLLKYNRVSMITAFNFMVPVFGAVLSAVFLHESILEWRNAVALVLVCYGHLAGEQGAGRSFARRPRRPAHRERFVERLRRALSR